MTRVEAQGFLTDVGLCADGKFPLLEAALACAVHEDPTRDPDQVRALAEDAVERLSARLQREVARLKRRWPRPWPVICAWPAT